MNNVQQVRNNAKRRRTRKPTSRQHRILSMAPSTLKKGEVGIVGFAGIGGWCTGWLRAVGVPPYIAVNHDAYAIAVHSANHPETKHFRDDIFCVDIRAELNGLPVGWAHISPDCRDFSRAKGKKPVSKKIRGLAWIGVKWAAHVSPRILSLENVPEFKEWGPLIAKRDKETGRVLRLDGTIAAKGERVPLQEQQLVRDPKRRGETFRQWCHELRAMGYVVEWRELKACDYGAATSRKRLFLLARRDGKPIRWPEATHGPKGHPRVKSGELLPFKTAAECIDWTNLGKSIFDRKKPLADATLRRIAEGINRYVLKRRPFIVNLTHGGRLESVDEPIKTVTGAHRGEKAIVTPLLSKTHSNGWDRNAAGVTPADQPAATILAKDGLCVVAPTLIQTGYGEREGQKPRCLDIEAPVGTVVATGQKHALCGALLKHYGGVVGQPVDQPAATITAKDHHSLLTAHVIQQNYGTSQWQSPETPLNYGNSAITSNVDTPLHTVTTKDRFALVVELLERFVPGLHFPDGVATVEIDGVTYFIADIQMRMLTSRELARCQGFDDDYILLGTATQQVAGIGNSVPPAFGDALASANTEEVEIAA